MIMFSFLLNQRTKKKKVCDDSIKTTSSANNRQARDFSLHFPVHRYFSIKVTLMTMDMLAVCDRPDRTRSLLLSP